MMTELVGPLVYNVPLRSIQYSFKTRWLNIKRALQGLLQEYLELFFILRC